jgi:hypothetical protein
MSQDPPFQYLHMMAFIMLGLFLLHTTRACISHNTLHERRLVRTACIQTTVAVDPTLLSLSFLFLDLVKDD